MRGFMERLLRVEEIPHEGGYILYLLIAVSR